MWIGRARRKKTAIIPYLESRGVRFKKLGRKSQKTGRATDAMNRFVSQKVSAKSIVQWERAKKERSGRIAMAARKAALLPAYSDSGLHEKVVRTKEGPVNYAWREWTFPVRGRAAKEKYSVLTRLALTEVKPLLLDSVAAIMISLVALTEEGTQDYRRAWTVYHRIDDDSLEALALATDALLVRFKEYEELIAITDIAIHTMSYTSST